MSSVFLMLIQFLILFYIQAKLFESKKNIEDHESFHDSLLNLEKWLMFMKQKMESFHTSSGEWSIKGRQHEAEVCVCSLTFVLKVFVWCWYILFLLNYLLSFLQWPRYLNTLWLRKLKKHIDKQTKHLQHNQTGKCNWNTHNLSKSSQHQQVKLQCVELQCAEFFWPFVFQINCTACIYHTSSRSWLSIWVHFISFIVSVYRENWGNSQRRSFICSSWRSRVREFWRTLQARDRSIFCETWSA